MKKNVYAYGRQATASPLLFPLYAHVISHIHTMRIHEKNGTINKKENTEKVKRKSPSHSDKSKKTYSISRYGYLSESVECLMFMLLCIIFHFFLRTIFFVNCLRAAVYMEFLECNTVKKSIKLWFL